MITDRFPLTGSPAYLAAPGGGIDLAAGVPAAGSGPASGISPPIGEHRVLDVDSIDLLFEANDLVPLLARAAQPIIEVRTKKELFPQLVTDPFARRVHTIGGMDDFSRGTLDGCRVMEIEGRATLVTETGGAARWTSPRFVFAGPLPIADVAWELALSRLGPVSTFDYDLKLRVWDGPPDALVAQAAVAITGGAGPAAPRARQLPADVVATAVQLEFVARVSREAAVIESHSIETSDGRLGIPMLQAIHLLERRDSAMAFHSLHELNVRSKEFTLYGTGDAPLTTGIARLDFRAALTGGDAIEIVVAPGSFRAFEARLSASIIERAPVTHR